MAQEIYNPHDLFLKATLSSPQAIQDFFQAHLPAHLLKRIDLHTIQPTQASYVSPALKALHPDLVFACPIDHKPGYLYLLLEHQSTPDWLMPLRFIKADVGLIEDYMKGKKARTPWPIIVNLCLYHGKKGKPYPYSVQVYDYFTDPLLAEQLGMLTRFHLLDLTGAEDKTLEGHKSVSLMEKLMKYSRDRELFKVIRQELDRLRDWLLGMGMRVHPIGFDYWETVLLYTSSVLNPKYNSAEELVALFAEKLSKNKEEVMRTIAQQIERRIKPQLERRLRREVEESVMQQGMQQGIQQGMQQGMQQEKLGIAKNMLLDLHLGMDVVQKVTGLSREKLKQLQAEATSR